MRKLLAAAAVFLLIVCGGCGTAARNDELRAASLHDYEMDIEFLPSEHKLICSQKTVYVNPSEDTLSELYFHVFPNDFSNGYTAPFSASDMGQAYPRGFSAGGTDIKSLSSDGKPLEYSLQGRNRSVMHIPLAEPLPPGGSIALDMEYEVTVPDCRGRFGYGPDGFSLANFYPIAAVYDDRGWHRGEYTAVGDPFFSECSHYKVSIKAPEGYVIAATADMRPETESGISVWKGEAFAVRDFAWFASAYYKMLEAEEGGVKVRSYFYGTDKAGRIALEAAASAIKTLSSLYGDYPYDTFSVVQSDFFIGGMEYPCIVQLSDYLYGDYFADELAYVVAHEAAHQWFYGLVGSDQLNEPWLDEALTEYASGQYLFAAYEEDEALSMRDKFSFAGANAFPPEKPANLPVYMYKDNRDYSLHVYSYGAMAFDAAASAAGYDAFNRMLRGYVAENKYKNAYSDELFSALGDELSSMLRLYLSEPARLIDGVFIPAAEIKKPRPCAAL